MTTVPTKLFACPCCAQLTLSENNAYEICPVCLWEDDPVQISNPSYGGGANGISLIEARKKWPHSKSSRPFAVR
jgi:hypothetical protein